MLRMLPFGNIRLCFGAVEAKCSRSGSSKNPLYVVLEKVGDTMGCVNSTVFSCFFRLCFRVGVGLNVEKIRRQIF